MSIIKFTIPEDSAIEVTGAGTTLVLNVTPMVERTSILKINTGLRGYSAYEIAVQNGYTGTIQQWLNSLNGVSVISIVAAVAIGSNRVILSSGNYADNTNISEIGLVVGISKSAVNIGELVSVVYSGELNGFTGLIVNQSVYVSVNGTLTQTIPTSGYIQKLGVATSSSTILIHIDPPIEVI